MNGLRQEARVAVVIEAAAWAFRVPVLMMTDRVRSEPVATARMVCYWIFHRHLGMSTTTTAHIFKRDHSAVVHGVRRVEARMVSDKRFSQQCECLLAEVTAEVARTNERTK